MFKIFVPAHVLLDVYNSENGKIEEKQSYFYRLLKYAAHDIYMTGVDLNDYDRFDENDLSDAHLLKIMESEFQGVFHNNDDYIEEIIKDNSKVLKEPCAAFYIDGISSEQAKEIQENYGVICKSASEEVDMNVFMMPMETYNLTKYRTYNDKWNDIFDISNEVPSNAALIVDRNLFVYDGKSRKEKIGDEEVYKIGYDGLENIFKIFEHVLPESFKGTCFDLTIMFEQESLKENFTFDKLCEEICVRIQSLKREYGINVSIISFRKGDNSKKIKPAKFYNELTHTRQIISNYYRISAENGLNTIMYNSNGEESGSHYSQVVYSMLLFSSGLRRKGADPAETSIRRIDDDVKRFINYWKTKPLTEEYKIYTFFVDNNGKKMKEGDTVYDFENRLFT